MTSIEAQKYVKEAFKITWDLGYSPRTRREIAYLITSIPENLREETAKSLIPIATNSKSESDFLSKLNDVKINLENLIGTLL